MSKKQKHSCTYWMHCVNDRNGRSNIMGSDTIGVQLLQRKYTLLPGRRKPKQIHLKMKGVPASQGSDWAYFATILGEMNQGWLPLKQILKQPVFLSRHGLK